MTFLAAVVQWVADTWRRRRAQRYWSQKVVVHWWLVPLRNFPIKYSDAIVYLTIDTTQKKGELIKSQYVLYPPYDQRIWWRTKISMDCVRVVLTVLEPFCYRKPKTINIGWTGDFLKPWMNLITFLRFACGV